MELILQFLLFCGACIISFYLPGLIFTRFLLKSKEDSWLVSWIVGIVLFILGNYFFSWIHVPYGYLVFILFSLSFVIWKRKEFRFIPEEKWDKWVISIIVLGSIAFVSLSLTSGVVTKNGEQFMGLNAIDGITHVSYIKSQILYFPPQHPEIANVSLRGYHYFYDFLLSRFVLFFHLRVEDLFFRFAPLLISLLYGFSFYYLSKRITKNILSQRLIVFFVYFGSGFGYFLSLIRSDFNPLTAQPIDVILDPSMILAITVLVTAVSLLPNIKRSWQYALLIGVFAGILAQIKVYVGIIGIITFFLFVLCNFILSSWKERKLLMVTFLTSLVILAITFFPNNFNSGRFIFAPFNFYQQFMQQGFFDKLHWGVVMQIYQSHKNVIRLTQMTVEAVALYWLINMGIRLVMVGGIRSFIQKSFWKSDYTIVILSICCASIIFPSLFLQSPSPFEVMQFTWITNIFLGVPTGIILGNFLAKRTILVRTIVVLFVVGVSMPQTIGLELQYIFPRYQIAFTPKQLTVFDAIHTDVPQNSYYIVLPDRLTYTTKDGHLVDKLLWYWAPLTTALTGKRAYYEDNATPFSESKIVNQRIRKMFALSNAIQSCNTDAIQKVVSIISTKYLLTYYPQPCLATSSAVLSKVESNKYSYYQFR